MTFSKHLLLFRRQLKELPNVCPFLKPDLGLPRAIWLVYKINYRDPDKTARRAVDRFSWPDAPNWLRCNLARLQYQLLGTLIKLLVGPLIDSAGPAFELGIGQIA